VTPNQTWQWTHTPESYRHPHGLVIRAPDGEWVAKIVLNGKVCRLAETYASAVAAMGAAERTWMDRNAQHE
jgi:hypothetical protein